LKGAPVHWPVQVWITDNEPELRARGVQKINQVSQRSLKRCQVVRTVRLSGIKKFMDKREKLILNMFVNFRPAERLKTDAKMR